MTINRRTLLSGGAGAAGVALTGSAPRPLRAASVESTLRFIPSTPLPSLDPIAATIYVVRDHGYMVYDTLFATDESFTTRPQMVSEWQTSPDGLRWTFHLRDGLTFHDGLPVQSKDCIASIKRWSRRDGFGQTFADYVERYSSEDTRTFSIHLKRPFPLLPDALGKLSSNVPFIMPERIAETDAYKLIKDATGSGPYRFEARQWVPGQNAVYTRFADYRPREEAPSWAAGGKVAKIDRIEWLAINEVPAAIGAMLQGDVDWYEQPPTDVLTLLEQKETIRIQNIPLGLLLVLRFNHQQPPFDNPGVRRAVMMAMKQDDYMQAVVGDSKYYKEAKTFFTPGTPMSSGSGGAAAIQGDLDRARAMLKEEGYKGERVVLLAPADQPIAFNQSLITQDLLKRLGMNVEFVATDWGSFTGVRQNRGTPDQGGWSVFHTQWSGADALNPALHTLIRTNGSAGWFGWPDDARLEHMRTDWISTADQSKQIALAERIERRAFEVAPYVPAGYVEKPMAINMRLKGVISAPALFFWNISKA